VPFLFKSILMVVMLQALLGCFIFGEETSLLWWSGATLVLLGLMLICQPHKQHEQ
jgi:drug/metabolite transporter (DMT)-like permease